MPRTDDRRKGARLNLRINAQEKLVLEQAARLRHKTVSSFVVDEAYQAAQEVLADQVQFVLSQEEWDTFCQLLDRPPRVLPGLRTLLSTETPLDGK